MFSWPTDMTVSLVCKNKGSEGYETSHQPVTRFLGPCVVLAVKRQKNGQRTSFSCSGKVEKCRSGAVARSSLSWIKCDQLYRLLTLVPLIENQPISTLKPYCSVAGKFWKAINKALKDTVNMGTLWWPFKDWEHFWTGTQWSNCASGSLFVKHKSWAQWNVRPQSFAFL